MPTFKHPCPHCGQFINRDVAVCPACGMEVPRPWTTAYKRQWTLRRKKNFERHKRSIKLARNKVKSGEWRKV